MKRRCLPDAAVRALPVLLLALGTVTPAAASDAQAWRFGAVVDVGTTSRATAFGSRERGLGLGPSDVTAWGPVGAALEGQATVAAHAHDGRIEVELEELWLQTRSLPAGLTLRLGRFLAQVGYLNERHPHADDFAERPLAYRAFLGGHWFDDGVRVNWLLPTPLYWRVGVEAFRGRQLVPDAVRQPAVGSWTFSTKAGGDVGTMHSWQLGIAYVHNRLEAVHGDDHGHDDDHDHAHVHGARFGGRHLWMFDAAWKWAPDGNAANRELRVLAEHSFVTGLGGHADGDDRHQASSIAAVWRFRPGWEVGWRTDRLRALSPHGDHFHPVHLDEHAVMVAWKPTHLQTLRLQFTTQRHAKGLDDAARHSVQLQYVFSLGAHPAHTY